MRIELFDDKTGRIDTLASKANSVQLLIFFGLPNSARRVEG